ncbi:hypothetical protein QVD17_05428 [Tagetes erecta]|uniref:Uncharacterized protein n=1 Tax=Tagetes erecta TaxID=13708 RepID=A0AAD8PAI7_TARER|nr:hypothetical protein QVD17_05428 [Tagetes erecta]
MGRTRSSSRRKYSKKKKKLKVSSEGYRKKKSRRSKSKKLHRDDDSFSSSSDDESTSSSLNTSSGSESERKRKRGRSSSRNERKGSKKRSRRRSLSEDSSNDSSPVKKRKRSKKSKKIKKKKKSKRDVYVSSASSDSGSCSTCKDEDSSSDEPDSIGRSRGRSREKKKDRIDSSKGRTGNRKNRSKTRSSISPSSSYGGESIEKVTIENNPRRLKSVITVANLGNEGDNVKNDEVKEETVYDYDDYPSSKSNDSVELVDRFNSSPDKKSGVKEVNSGSNLDDNKEKESNVSGNIGSETDDLESILRQKALENLSKFRGGVKTKPVAPVDDKPKTVLNRSRFTWKRDPSVTTAKDEKAATYSKPQSSGSQSTEPKLQSTNIASTSRVDDNTNNVDQKSTAVVETASEYIKEGSSKEQQNESNDNSQFEKKTMSVMRGGEMVQVNYKVYIPNRAPALARRQLKR